MGFFSKDKKEKNYERPLQETPQTTQNAPSEPPPYNEYEQSLSQGIPSYDSQHQTPQGYPDEKKQNFNQHQTPQGYPDEKKQYEQYENQSNSNQYNQYPPQNQFPQGANDPGVYVVPRYEPTVNIAYARPDQVDPAYQDYLRRDQERVAQGDLPNNHNKPLSKGKVNKSNKTGGSAFPGRQGASYYEAANK